jgi:hypothetical protein
MATGNNGATLHLTFIGLRTRKNDVSERKVDCVMPGCNEKQKTFRVMARHFKEKHTSKDVLGIQCDICEWACYKNLKCFTVHMKKHNITVDMVTPMTLKVVRKTKWTDHTAICNTMKAETHAINKEKKDREKAAEKAAKKEAKIP